MELPNHERTTRIGFWPPLRRSDKVVFFRLLPLRKTLRIRTRSRRVPLLQPPPVGASDTWKNCCQIDKTHESRWCHFVSLRGGWSKRAGHGLFSSDSDLVTILWCCYIISSTTSLTTSQGESSHSTYLPKLSQRRAKGQKRQKASSLPFRIHEITKDYTPHLRVITVVSQTHGITTRSSCQIQLRIIYGVIRSLLFDDVIETESDRLRPHA